ncbi:MAG: PqqD family protein [Dongiaceae bacterium]
MSAGARAIPSVATDRSACRLLRFANLSRPIAFVDSDAVADILLCLLRGWPLAADQQELVNGDAIVTVRSEPTGFRIECGWSQGVRNLPDPVDAACALIAELIQALLAEQRERLCLHSAAVEIAGRLVVFPSDYRAGKSSFVVALAAQGLRVFSDDVLPLTARGDGVAPGLAPRLRRPLPADMSATLRSFVEDHRGPTSPGYRYLDLDSKRLASFGEAAPIGAFVLLEREEGAETRLTDTSAGEVLRRLVLRNFARGVPAPVILERLRALVEGGPRYRLRYSRAEDGVALLLRVAETWRGRPAAHSVATARGPTLAVPAVTVPTVPQGCLQQHPAVAELTVDQEAFLTDPSGWSIHYLNPLGAALWRLFVQPMSVADAVEILHAAFPDRSRSQLARDVGHWINQVRAQGFLISGDDPVGVDGMSQSPLLSA